MRLGDEKRVRRLMSAFKYIGQQGRKIKTQISDNSTLSRIGKLKGSYHQSDIWKLLPNKSVKERQELFQENLQLRKRVHELENQINLGKGKIEVEKKKNIRFTKKLERQYQKQLYWSGNNKNLIQGVKLQYEKLKQSYQLQQQQMQTLKKNIQYVTQLQYKIYAETLQKYNQQLVKQIQTLKLPNPLDLQQYHNTNTQHLINQAQKQQQKLINKNNQLSQQINSLENNIQQKNQKIKFLQKLLIERDNNQHNSHKKARQLQKEVNQLQKKVKQLQEEIYVSNQEHKSSMDTLNKTLNKKYEMQQSIFQKEILEKQKKIGKLEKEVSYLSTLLSYWKPLDQLKKQEFSNQDRQSDIQSSIELQNQLKVSKEVIIISRERSQTIVQSPQLKPSKTDESQKYSLNSQRHQRTSAQKNTQNAVKVRKIQFRQVQHLSFILKYRLIGYGKSLEEVKNYFNSNSNDPWIKEYITMSEIKSVLKQLPFNLPNSEAQLLSRYIIEDSNEEFVYCDQTNQLSRSIAKSIIRSLIGQYQLPNPIQAEKEWKEIIGKYGKNLKAALNSIAPNGLISDNKLVELLNSLGIEPSNQCILWIFGKMLLECESNQKMKYEMILGDRI